MSGSGRLLRGGRADRLVLCNPGFAILPLRGLCDIGGARRAARSYREPYREVDRISLMPFEPDEVEVHLDGVRMRQQPGQKVVSHGVDRNPDLDETTAVEQP